MHKQLVTSFCHTAMPPPFLVDLFVTAYRSYCHSTTGKNEESSGYMDQIKYISVDSTNATEGYVDRRYKRCLSRVIRIR